MGRAATGVLAQHSRSEQCRFLFTKESDSRAAVLHFPKNCQGEDNTAPSSILYHHPFFLPCSKPPHLLFNVQA